MKSIFDRYFKKLLQYALLTEKEKLEFLELVIGEKDVNDMNSKITYTDEPMEMGQVVKDFVPPPNQLVPKGKTKTNQVTLELTEETISFFKAQADRKQIPYEKIIELLVEQYCYLIVRQSLLDHLTNAEMIFDFPLMVHQELSF